MEDLLLIIGDQQVHIRKLIYELDTIKKEYEKLTAQIDSQNTKDDTK